MSNKSNHSPSGSMHAYPHPVLQHLLGNRHSWSWVQLLMHVPMLLLGSLDVTMGQNPGLGSVVREITIQRVQKMGNYTFVIVGTVTHAPILGLLFVQQMVPWNKILALVL